MCGTYCRFVVINILHSLKLGLHKAFIRYEPHLIHSTYHFQATLEEAEEETKGGELPA